MNKKRLTKELSVEETDIAFYWPLFEWRMSLFYNPADHGN